MPGSSSDWAAQSASPHRERSRSPSARLARPQPPWQPRPFDLDYLENPEGRAAADIPPWRAPRAAHWSHWRPPPPDPRQPVPEESTESTEEELQEPQPQSVAPPLAPHPPAGPPPPQFRLANVEHLTVTLREVRVLRNVVRIVLLLQLHEVINTDNDAALAIVDEIDNRFMALIRATVLANSDVAQ